MSLEHADSAIIVAGGESTRFNDGQKGGFPKHLFPIAGRSLLVRSSELMSHFTDNIIIVANERTAPLFREHLKKDLKDCKEPTVIIQNEQIGVANAIIEALLNENSGKSLVVILGDNYFDPNIIDFDHVQSIIAKINSDENVGLLVVQEKDEPKRYAIISFAQDGSVSEIVEKPVNPKSNLAVRGFYVLPTQKVFSAYKNIEPSERGEYEIGTLLNTMLQNGTKFELMRIPKDALAINIDTREVAKKTSKMVAQIEKA